MRRAYLDRLRDDGDVLVRLLLGSTLLIRNWCRAGRRRSLLRMVETASEMSNMQAEVYAAFRAIDVPEDKAVKAAEALSRRDDDVAALKSDVALLKWMTGTGIGLTLILLGSDPDHVDQARGDWRPGRAARPRSCDAAPVRSAVGEAPCRRGATVVHRQ